MKRTFIFDFDDTLAGFSLYNTWGIYLDLPLVRPIGGPLPGAIDVLEELRRRRDRLYLFTLNLVLNEDMKWRKIRRLGMDRYFNRNNTYMVRKKTPELFRTICKGQDPSRCYMVGNSFRNDIEPALEAGINAIYIPRPVFKRALPWTYRKHERLSVLSDIRQVPEMDDRP